MATKEISYFNIKATLLYLARQIIMIQSRAEYIHL